MAESVTLDAMISRADFALESSPNESQELAHSLSVESIASGIWPSLLRKPDFQRETNHWTSNQVLSFIESFLDHELIPSVILWKSQSFFFVIDGAHRLSALRAWINDDYGDKGISNKYFSNDISNSQKKIAEKTRKIINAKVGSYQELREIVTSGADYDALKAARARNMVSRVLNLQWVNGDAAKAESSFFKINTKGTPLDKTEELVLKNRNRSVAIAARSIVRAATGHKYWSNFKETNTIEIEKIAKNIHHILFRPELETPIKTLDLPLGGNKSPLDALDMLMNIVSITNADLNDFKKPYEKFLEDTDGSQTLLELKKSETIISRVCGNSNGSLGLHPAIYFYSERGRHLPDLLLGMIFLIRTKIQNNDNHFFKKFTLAREKLETYLIQNKSILTQILNNARSNIRQQKSSEIFEYLVNKFYKKEDPSLEELIATLFPGSQSKIVTITASITSEKFSDDTKSEIFINQALKSAIKCPECNGYLDVQKSGSYDHIERVREGGVGTAMNGQLTHHYCNQSMKN